MSIDAPEIQMDQPVQKDLKEPAETYQEPAYGPQPLPNESSAAKDELIKLMQTIELAKQHGSPTVPEDAQKDDIQPPVQHQQQDEQTPDEKALAQAAAERYVTPLYAPKKSRLKKFGEDIIRLITLQWIWNRKRK